MSEIIGTVRASSWGDMADCEYRWYWKNIEGLRMPIGGALVVGSGVHRGTDVFDRARMEKRPAHVEEAVQAAVEYVQNPVDEKGRPEHIDWYDEDEKITQGVAIDFAAKLTAKYCQAVAPALKYTGIELKCEALDITTEFGVVRLTGSTDRILQEPDMTEGILDFKTGGKAVNTEMIADTKGHQFQLGAYTLMTEATTKKALGAAHIIGFQTNSKLRIGMGKVDNPKLALLGDEERPGMIHFAARSLKTGLFHPNPKSMLCSERWCPAHSRCIYKT